MTSLTDWLAATFFVSADDVQTHKDVAAAQQAIVDKQYATGVIGPLDYYNLSGQITAAGNYTADYVDQNSGVFGFFKTIPWWVYALLAGALFLWVGGFSWIRGILKK